MNQSIVERLDRSIAALQSIRDELDKKPPPTDGPILREEVADGITEFRHRGGSDISCSSRSHGHGVFDASGRYLVFRIQPNGPWVVYDLETDEQIEVPVSPLQEEWLWTDRPGEFLQVQRESETGDTVEVMNVVGGTSAVVGRHPGPWFAGFGSGSRHYLTDGFYAAFWNGKTHHVGALKGGQIYNGMLLTAGAGSPDSYVLIDPSNGDAKPFGRPEDRIVHAGANPTLPIAAWADQRDTVKGLTVAWKDGGRTTWTSQELQEALRGAPNEWYVNIKYLSLRGNAVLASWIFGVDESEPREIGCFVANPQFNDHLKIVYGGRGAGVYHLDNEEIRSGPNNRSWTRPCPSLDEQGKRFVIPYFPRADSSSRIRMIEL